MFIVVATHRDHLYVLIDTKPYKMCYIEDSITIIMMTHLH